MKHVTALLLSLVAFALCAVSLASAAELEWNQERIAALVQDLIKQLEVIRADLESRPSVPEKEAARATIMSDLECPMPHRSGQFLPFFVGFHPSLAARTIEAGVRPRVR